MGAGLLEANRTGGTVKRAHCGWAAHAGVCAAELARPGLPGRPRCWRAASASSRPTAATTATPKRSSPGWARTGSCLTVFFKPYPCNHFTHPGIDAALQLRGEGLEPERDRGDRARGADRSPAHDRRALRGEDPPALRVPRAVQRPVHRRRSPARRRRSRPLPRRLHGRAGARHAAARAGRARPLRPRRGVRPDIPSTFSRPPARPSALWRRARMLRAVESRRPRAAAVRR